MIIIIFLICIIGFIIVNIQLLKSPEILIKIELSEVNSEEAIINTILNIDNQNSFDINIKNLKIIVLTPDGYKIAEVAIKDRKIPSYKNKNFTNEIIVSFDGHSPELITTKITGEVSANFIFIEKTIPIKMGVITSLENFLDEISVPSLSVNVESIDLTKGGLNLISSIDIYNPNTFEIFIDDISLDIESEIGKKVGNADLEGEKIPAKDFLSIKSNITILFEALNAEKLKFNVSGKAGAKIAGFEKKIPFNIQTKIIVPDLEEILLSKDSPTLISIKLDEKLTLKGILFYVTLEVFNNYNVDLIIRNVTIGIYSVIDDTNFLIGESDKINDIISKVGTSGYLTCEILVPYSKLITNLLKVDWIMASGIGRVTIEGINQSAFLEIRGYHSLHPFT